MGVALAVIEGVSVGEDVGAEAEALGVAVNGRVEGVLVGVEGVCVGG